MPDAFTCPHCEMVIDGADDLGASLTACPHCLGPLDTPETAPAPRPHFETIANPTAPAAARFTFACRRCASILEATSAQSGSAGRCPTCGATFIIPAIDPRTAVPLSRPASVDDGQLPTPLHAYAAAGGRAPRIERDPDGSQSIVCPRCAGRSPIDANLCRICGTPFTMDGAEEIAKASSGASPLASASLIVALLICLPLGPLAIALGVLALRRADPKAPGANIARAGIFIGILASLAWAFAITH